MGRFCNQHIGERTVDELIDRGFKLEQDLIGVDPRTKKGQLLTKTKNRVTAELKRRTSRTRSK